MSAGDLRSRADRLYAEAEEAEARAARQEKMLAEMTPKQRCAIILYSHFARTYPGAGGAMDAGSEWGYETDLVKGEVVAHHWHKPEHTRFVNMVEEICRETGMHPTNLETFLQAIVTAMKGYTMVSVVDREKRYLAHSITRERDEAIETITKIYDRIGGIIGG